MRCILFVILCGCLPGPVAVHWPESLRPVVLRVDTGMSPECEDAVFEAVDWWQKRVGFLQVEMAAVSAHALMGEILIRQGELESPLVGLCDSEWAADDGALLRAYVTLESCDAQVATHEIGHALGLRHDSDPLNLMYMYDGSGWELTTKQLRQIQ